MTLHRTVRKEQFISIVLVINSRKSMVSLTRNEINENSSLKWDNIKY